MRTTHVAMACKLMPYYRLGIFQELSSLTSPYEFTFFGDTQEQGGIKQIPISYATHPERPIRWKKTRNYFYKPERLLWQTGIIKAILGSKYKAFVFEGAIAHYPIWLYAFLCKVMGKKVIYWTHGDRGLDQGLKKSLRSILFKTLGDGLFLYGHFQKENMMKDGYNPSTTQVIYNSLQPREQFELLDSIDQRRVQNEKQQLFQNPDVFTFLFVGRLVASKGVLDILKVQNQLKTSGTMTNCIFIGDGAERSVMEQFVLEKGLESQVHFAGALYEESKIAPYFCMADMMISPGNVGLNCIHALAYGVPVLTHDNFVYQNPEVEAIKDGVNGIFYTYGSFEDMVVKITDWIKNADHHHSLTDTCQQIIQETYNPQYQAQCMVAGLNAVFDV